MTKQTILMDETGNNLSPNFFEVVGESLVEVSKSIQYGMNPTKSIKRRRMIRSTKFDINEYIQPSRIFDIKRLWTNEMKIKSMKHGRKIKVNPLHGFQDPLKLRKKCFLKMPSVPGQPFILIYEDVQYIPPASSVPPHILSVERILPKLPKSPMLSEVDILGKYINPSFLKPKVKGRLKGLTLSKAKAIPDFPEEFALDRYHAPEGSKENYTCRNIPDITAAEKALESVSIFMNTSSCSSLDLIQKISNDLSQTLVTSTVHENMQSCVTALELDSNDKDRDLESVEKALEDAPISINCDCGSLENSTIDSLNSAHNELLKLKLQDTDSLGDDSGWTKLHRGSSNLSSESENEEDPFVNIAEFKNNAKRNDLFENKIGDGMDYSRNDTSQSSNLVIEILNMKTDKPHSVRRILKKSPSVSEWIDDNIFSVQFENQLDGYRPPSLTKMTLNYMDHSSISKLKFRQDTARDLRSKSCCALGGGINSDNVVLHRTSEATSDTSLCFTRKSKSSSDMALVENGPRRHNHHHHQAPKSVNSLDDVLKLRLTNPVGFCVLRTLCSKKFVMYEGDGSNQAKQTTLQTMSGPKQNPRKLNAKQRKRKLLTSLWLKHAVLIMEDESDEGYLASEEDEEYKFQVLNDFWPIPSQCTTTGPQSQSSLGNTSNDGSSTFISPQQGQDESVLIDYDDSEHWSQISAYEDLFSQLHNQHPLISQNYLQQQDDNHDDDVHVLLLRQVQQELYFDENNAPKAKDHHHRWKSNGVQRCFLKMLTWCKNGLLKNL